MNPLIKRLQDELEEVISIQPEEEEEKAHIRQMTADEIDKFINGSPEEKITAAIGLAGNLIYNDMYYVIGKARRGEALTDEEMLVGAMSMVYGKDPATFTAIITQAGRYLAQLLLENNDAVSEPQSPAPSGWESVQA